MEVVVPKRLVLVLVVVMVGLVGGGLAYVRLPRAAIVVSPALEPREITQEITLSTKATSPDFKNFVLPAQVVEAEVTETKEVKREGSNVKDGLAQGVVILRNDQGEEQSLVAKTHLRHKDSGVFFLTDSPVKIPPEGEVAVKVTAKEAGKSGNVPAGDWVVDKLPVSLQEVVYGRSDSDFTGGVVSDVPITEAEIAGALNEAKTAAQSRILGTLTAKAGGAQLPPDLVEVVVVKEEASAEPGSAATSFKATVQVQSKGFAVNQSDLLSLTLLALKAMKSQEEEFVSYEPSSFGVKIVRSDFERGEARVEGKLTGLFSYKLGQSAFAPTNLAGLSAIEVQERFAQMQEVDKAEVEFWPFWVQVVPARAGAVDITVKDVSSEVTVSE